jgi:hypothetical protein
VRRVCRRDYITVYTLPVRVIAVIPISLAPTLLTCTFSGSLLLHLHGCGLVVVVVVDAPTDSRNLIPQPMID